MLKSQLPHLFPKLFGQFQLSLFSPGETSLLPEALLDYRDSNPSNGAPPSLSSWDGPFQSISRCVSCLLNSKSEMRGEHFIWPATSSTVSDIVSVFVDRNGIKQMSNTKASVVQELAPFLMFFVAETQQL